MCVCFCVLKQYQEEREESSWERPRLVEALPLPTDAAPELGADRHHPSIYYYCAATGVNKYIFCDAILYKQLSFFI